MQSPLPDASALEAGILEDERPSRFSVVQDNVRNLLRASVCRHENQTPTIEQDNEGLYPQPLVPHGRAGHASGRRHSRVDRLRQSLRSALSSPLSAAHPTYIASPPLPSLPAHVSSRPQEVSSHPDVDHHAITLFQQNKAACRQQRAQTRRTQQRHSQRSGVHVGYCIFCITSAVVLAALVATYLSMALTHRPLGPTFHVIFLLCILVTTILFCHSMVRLCMLAAKNGSARRTRRPRNHRPRVAPALSRTGSYVPPRAIRVYLATDELDLHPEPGRNAEAEAWDKGVNVPPPPPPAYGLWRSSVRVNPDLLHWRRNVDAPPVSPLESIHNVRQQGLERTDDHAAEAAAPRPPSYISDDGVSCIADAVPRSLRRGVVPEMVEVRGVGTAF
ncbi:hypothetical protein LTR66_004040 [Elasticomyces elasticus]|nr:hypothetical protein LTR66_004040 [Elasticomyces elasticus]